MFFKEQLKGNTSLLAYVGTIVLTFLGYFIIGQMPLTAAAFYQLSRNPDIGTDEIMRLQNDMDFTKIGLSQNTGLVLILMMFIFAMLGLWIGVRYLHKLPFKSLITPKTRINWGKVVFGFALWFGLTALFEAMVYFMHPENYTLNLDIGKWLVLFVISFLLIPIQSSWEELVMRGYLMPGLGLWLNNKWIPLIITSLIFALLHGMNPEVEKYGIGIMATYYIGAGLFLGIITVMDDSLELALGVHAATNIFASLFMTFDGSVLQTDAVFRVKAMNPYWMTGMFFICAAIFYLICYKKYNWRSLNTIFYPLNDANSTKNHTT